MKEPKETEIDLEELLTDDEFQWDDLLDGEEAEEVPEQGQILRLKPNAPVKVKYDNARKMARAIQLQKGCRYYAIIKGTFIFGDFIEALTAYHNLEIEEAWVTTLGMNENNIDSLVNLIRLYGAEKVNLLVSSYFFGVERHNLIQYLIEESADKPFDIAVAGNHSKITCIKANGLHLVMHGSANLSSSMSVEQFELEDNPDLYDYNVGTLIKIFDRHTIIQGATKELALSRAKKSWHNHLWNEIKDEGEQL